jgi:signal transduction histidine kinase
MTEVAFPVSAVQLGAGVVAVAVAALAATHRKKPAGVPVTGIALAGAGWAFAAGAESLVADRGVSAALQMSQYLMADLVAISWLYIAVEYTGRSWFQQRHVAAVPLGVVLFGLVATLTNPWHGLVLDPATTVEGGVLVPVEGSLYWLRIGWDYAVILLGMGMLAVEVADRQGAYRVQALAVLSAGVVPSVAALVDALDLVGVAGFSPSAVGIAGSGVILLWALFSADFLELAPVARRRLVENMDDAVLALDTDGRVIDTNERARGLLALDDEDIGTPVAEAVAGHPALSAELTGDLATETDIALRQNGHTEYYHLNVSPVRSTRTVDDAPEVVGHSVVLRDITDRRRREEDLDLLKQVLARTLRHNIRNDMTAVKGYAELLAERAEGEDDLARRVLDTADDIVALSEKARDVEELVDAPRTRTTLHLAPLVERVVAPLRSAHPEATVTVKMPENCAVRAHEKFRLAVHNLVENALEHGGDAVRITAECSAGTVTLTVADNGPGIPAHEVEVVETGVETDLEHGSGLGLWVVDLVVERSGGRLAFDADDGTRARIELDAAA